MHIPVRLLCGLMFALAVARTATAETSQDHAAPVQAGPVVLNVATRPDFIPPDTLRQFEAESGISVHLETFASDEALLAGLRGGKSDWDLVAASADTALRLGVPEGLFQPVETGKLGNYGNVDPDSLAWAANVDPGNKIGVPFLWGSSGFAVNMAKLRPLLATLKEFAPSASPKVTPTAASSQSSATAPSAAAPSQSAPSPSADSAKNDSTADSANAAQDGIYETSTLLLDPAIAKRIAEGCGLAVEDLPADFFPAALAGLGLDPKKPDAKALDEVGERLDRLKPYLKRLPPDRFADALANGTVCVGFGASLQVADAETRADQRETGIELSYFVPREGARLWLDLLAIPVHSQHAEAARAFIDFLLRPEVIADVTDWTGAANPNILAAGFVQDDDAADETVFPSEATRARLFLTRPLSADLGRQESKIWSRTGH